jgi:hypothetical protein
MEHRHMKHLYACIAGVALGLAPRLLPAAGTGGLEVRAYVNDSCIVADEPYFMPDTKVSSDQKARALPLLGIVVGKIAELLIKYVVGHATEHILTAGGRKDTYYGVTREMNLFRAEVDPVPAARLNSRLGCMTVVAAKRYQPDSANCTDAYLPREIAAESVALPESEWKTTRSDESVENKLRRANICIDGQANAVYEARFEFSEDGTAYRLRDAGYRINTLLTAPARGTTRSVFYTVEIATPGQKHDAEDVISTAWVNLGTVNAGTQRDALATDNPTWLHVPPMSAEARRAYEESTRTQHEVAGEVAAAQRSISRNRRVADELQRRISLAPPEMAAPLAQEKQKVEVQIQVLESELQVSSAEYAALPRRQLEFMPVSIRVGITESRSEKAALLALAKVVDETGGVVASMGGDLTAGLVNNRRSIDPVAAPGGGIAKSSRAATDPGVQLESARALYYDKLVDYKAAVAAGRGEAVAREQLSDARVSYNSARRGVGLEALP